MITEIAEHSIDVSLLPKSGKILDLGARGFLFANELRRLGHTVYTVDIDPIVQADYTCAITDKDGTCGLIRDKDPQATRMGNGSDVVAYTLATFSKMVNVDFWDCIKMDIEGAEYEVLMSLKRAPARQLSVEFHLHTGIYGFTSMAQMSDKLASLGYQPVRHEMTKQHGLGLNFWDSLFILS